MKIIPAIFEEREIRRLYEEEAGRPQSGATRSNPLRSSLQRNGGAAV